MWPALLCLLCLFVGRRYFLGKLLGDTEMLAIGAVVYIALPFVAFEYGLLEGMPGIELWRTLFEAADARDAAVALLCVALALAYLLGRHAASAMRAKLGTTMNRPLSESMLGAMAAGLWLIWALTTVANRDSFFQGYSIDYNTSLLGNLATVNLTALTGVLVCRQHGRGGTGYRALWTLLVVNSIGLLSLGGRMYVLIPVIALLLQTLAGVRSRSVRMRLFAGLAAFIGLLLAVGVFRIGADFSFSFLAYIGMAEGLFTSMSLGSFIDHNGLPALEAPYNFFGSIVNFVPSAVIENKAALVPSIQESGTYFESPLGATHLLVAVLGNFGWLGGLLFTAVLGWTLTAILRVSPRGWWLYFYLCSLLPFMFFRDGFSIFNKAALFNGCIVMWFIIGLDRLLRPRRRSPRQSTAPEVVVPDARP